MRGAHILLGLLGLVVVLLLIDCHGYREDVRQCAEFLKELSGEAR